jgi:hypothetical protein
VPAVSISPVATVRGTQKFYNSWKSDKDREKARKETLTALEQKYAKDRAAPTDVLEVWFAGCHCGSYSSPLSPSSLLICLSKMSAEAPWAMTLLTLWHASHFVG